MSQRIGRNIIRSVGLGVAVLIAAAGSAGAQTRVMTLGDSITQGGQGHVSYRYVLWFDLADAGYDVDFVGQRDFTNDGNPNPSWYPDYYSTFDRDHEGYWGWRTDEIAGIVLDAATTAQPDIVLIHLGTNDIGQMGAAGVTNADTNLRLIIERLRSVLPSVAILLAKVIPIGPGSSYFVNAAQVAQLNAVISTISSDLDTTESPIILVDQNDGFNLATMMQSDGLHPNLAGEAQMAGVWETDLASLLPGNPPPTVAISEPPDGATVIAPASIAVSAEATDPNGFVTQVSFFAGTTLLGIDTTWPYGIMWYGASAGNHVLTAVAEDDEGSTRGSAPVAVAVLPAGGAIPIAIFNPSFETPSLADGSLAEGPGTVGGWEFSGTSNTFVGIFNPPAGSYSEAVGDGTPIGADGANVAYLFNNGGSGESVSAEQLLGGMLEADTDYLLTVAIGKFLPNQPYAFSTYGGYDVELLAGGTPIASAAGTVDPSFGEFRDALAVVYSGDLDPGLIGEPLSVRLGLATEDAPRSTHFDAIRLDRFDVTGAGRVPDGSDGAPLLVAKAADQITLSWDLSCLTGDFDFGVYEGILGQLGSHSPLVCSTSGETTLTFTPSPADRYYLVVPHNTTREGSYGAIAAGAERQAALTPCLPQRIEPCEGVRSYILTLQGSTNRRCCNVRM